MTWLVLGIIIWSAIHTFPCLGQSMRAAFIEKSGETAYKSVFSLIVIASIVLMVFGWRSTIPDPVYTPPDWAMPVCIALMVLSFILFGAAKHATRIKRIIRHPQLTALIVWSLAHLLANGDNRSLVLFGGLGLWALIEIFLINRRDGAWQKPDAPSKGAEIKMFVISLAIFLAALFLHPYFTGVSPMPL